MATTKEFNISSNAVTVLNQTADAAENSAKKFTSAKQELRALTNQMLEMDQASEEFKKASARASELRDKMEELGENVRVNVGNSFEQASNSISLFTGRLLGGDLKGAGDALTNLGGSIRKISFKEIKQEIGGLTKGIISMGKALLANPIFLLAGVLIGVIAYWEEITDLVSGKSKMLEGLKKQEEILKAQEQNLTRQIALQKALGVSAGQLLKTELEMLKNKQQQAENAMKVAYLEKDRAAFLEAQQSQLQAINDLEIRKIKINQDAQALLDKIRSGTDEQYNKQLLQNQAFSEYKKATEELTVLQQLNNERAVQINKEIAAARQAGNNALANQLILERESLKNQNISLQNNKDEIWNAGQAAKDSVKTEKELEAIAKSKAAAAERKAKADADAKRIADEALAVDKRLDEVEKARVDAKKTALNKELDDTLALQKKEEEAYLAAKKSETELQDLKIRHSQELQGILEKFAELEQEKADEDAKRLKELQQEAINQKQAELIELQSIIDAADEANYQSKLSKQEQELMASQEYYFQLKTQAEAAGLDITALIEEQARKEGEIKKKYADEEIAKQQELLNFRLQQTSSAFEALGALNEAFTKKGQQQSRKQFQIQKALNLASAVVDTYGGINRALNDKTMPSTTARIIQASIVGAMGLANVIKISKTEYGNASAPSGTNMSAGSVGGGTEAPSPANFAFLGNQPNQQQPPLQAYVVSGQVSSNLEAQQLIQNQSRLGG